MTIRRGCPGRRGEPIVIGHVLHKDVDDRVWGKSFLKNLLSSLEDCLIELPTERVVGRHRLAFRHLVVEP